jgi:hypothetical protein
VDRQHLTAGLQAVSLVAPEHRVAEKAENPETESHEIA